MQQKTFCRLQARKGTMYISQVDTEEKDYVYITSGYSFGVIIGFHVPTKIWASLDDFPARLCGFIPSLVLGLGVHMARSPPMFCSIFRKWHMTHLDCVTWCMTHDWSSNPSSALSLLGSTAPRSVLFVKWRTHCKFCDVLRAWSTSILIILTIFGTRCFPLSSSSALALWSRLLRFCSSWFSQSRLPWSCLLPMHQLFLLDGHRRILFPLLLTLALPTPSADESSIASMRLKLDAPPIAKVIRKMKS